MIIKDKDLFVNNGDSNVLRDEVMQNQGEGSSEEVKNAVEGMENKATEETQEETTITNEETPNEEAPAEETPNEETPNEETPAVSEKSVQEILDELEQSTADIKKSQEEVDAKVTEIEENEQKGEDNSKAIEELGVKLDDMSNQITEKDREIKKLSYTVDFLQGQLDEATQEVISSKYGNVTDNGVMNIINEDSSLKNILSGTIKFKNDPAQKDTLVELYKNKLEELTGADFGEILNEIKNRTQDELSLENGDEATEFNTGEPRESLFV